MIVLYVVIAIVVIAVILRVISMTIMAARPTPPPPPPAAPGINPMTGEPPNLPPPPPPPGVTAPKSTPNLRTAAKFLAPSSALQHVPIVGDIMTVARTPATLATAGTLKINDTVTAALKHVPIAGGALAAPAAAAGSAIRKISSLF